MAGLNLRSRASDLALLRDLVVAGASLVAAAVGVTVSAKEFAYRRKQRTGGLPALPKGPYGELVQYPRHQAGPGIVIRPATREEWLAFRAGVVFVLTKAGAPAWGDRTYPEMFTAYVTAANSYLSHYTLAGAPETDPEPESTVPPVPACWTSSGAAEAAAGSQRIAYLRPGDDAGGTWNPGPDPWASVPADGARPVRALDVPATAIDGGGISLPWLKGEPPSVPSGRVCRRDDPGDPDAGSEVEDGDALDTAWGYGRYPAGTGEA